MHPDSKQDPPLLRHKSYGAPSDFTAKNLLREARRQKGVDEGPVPSVCLLDPDGDIVRNLRAQGRARKSAYWPCYHTELYEFENEGRTLGIVGCAVGGAFAVLVAEELFASGCELLVSVTSSGQIRSKGDPPYFVLIEKALRDEGTSYYYVPPSDFVHLDPRLAEGLAEAFDESDVPVYVGACWTTDAPFRETEAAIATARQMHILSVEMEAAALYAFAEARGKSVICFAHVTNQMAVDTGDFEKGEDQGSRDALHVVSLAVDAVATGGPSSRCDGL